MHSGLYWTQNVAHFDTDETYGMLMEFQEINKRKKNQIKYVIKLVIILLSSINLKSPSP